ncbi:MAG: hypothetical protein KDC14_01145 [Planctomycetes bacterium]|nr:hypothetical protein [Planctomycetota bacterium]
MPRMHRSRMVLSLAAFATGWLLVGGCGDDASQMQWNASRDRNAQGDGTTDPGSKSGPSADATDAGGVTATCTQGPAYLHGDIWPLWWNYRVQCDRQHKALWRCEKGGGDCSEEKKAVDDCDVCKQKDGICIPRSRKGEKDGCCDEGACCDYDGKVGADEDTHFWGYYRMCRTDCDTRDFEYDKMAGTFYGKGWKYLGQWHLDLVEANGDGDVGFAKKGVRVEHKDGKGYVGADEGDGQAFDGALGSFGCYELPVGKEVAVRIGVHDWNGEPKKDEEGGILLAKLTPEPGHHYVVNAQGGIDDITRWDREPCEGPPKAISDKLGGLSCKSVR